MSLQDPAVQAQIAQLLNFGTPEAPAELTPGTLATLEALVGTLYNPATPPHEAKIADDCLKQFKEHENAWFQCKTVLDQSQVRGGETTNKQGPAISRFAVFAHRHARPLSPSSPCLRIVTMAAGNSTSTLVSVMAR